MLSLITDLELTILYFIQTLHNPVLDWFMIKITFLGEVGWFWIALATIFLCFKKTRKIGIGMSVSILMGFLLGNVWLKNLFERQRPCWIDSSVSLLISNPRDFSFPSGHSLVSFEGAFSIYLHNKKWGIPAIILASFIAFSRLYLFVHFPTDVFMGSFMGIVIAWAVYRVSFCTRKNTCKPI